MKYAKHPDYKTIKAVCGCGNTIETRSTTKQEQIHLEVCSKCHPFYTGEQRIVDTAGQVDRFRRRYNISSARARKNRAQQPE